MIKLQASSASRFLKCPGSVKLEADLLQNNPDLIYNVYKDQANFGSLVHEIAEKELKESLSELNKKTTIHKKLIDAGFIKNSEGYIKAKHSAQYYVKEIQRILKTIPSDATNVKIDIEKKYRYKTSKFNFVFKADCLIFYKYDNRNYIIIIDLKTGNWDYSDSAKYQLQFSLYVLFRLYNIKTSVNYRGVIIQPNFYDSSMRTVINEYNIHPTMLDSMMHNVLDLTNNDLIDGDHCTFCSAFLVCPHKKDMLPVIDSQRNIEPTELSNEKLEKIYLQKKNIENYLNAVENIIKNKMEKGETFPTLEVTYRAGRRKWKDEKEVEKKLAFLGDELYEPKKLKSPSSIEKIAGKENIVGLYDQPKSKIIQQLKNPFEAVE